MTTGRQRSLPRPLVMAAVAATAATTAWAMWETGFRGPIMSWGQADDAVEQVWAPAPSHHDVRAVATPGGPMTIGAPPILYGSRRPHADRGACTMCHTLLTRAGTPVPTIHSFSTMPHNYRGICSNCHQVTVSGGAMAGAIGQENR